MIKTYLFDILYIKFSWMKNINALIILLLATSSLFSQDIQDADPDARFGSDNQQELSRMSTTRSNEAIVNVFSNAMVADVYVWNVPWKSTERTFPAYISLPVDNKKYTISLYAQSEFQYITNELQNFDFENKDIEEFENLQDQFERMKLGTKVVFPIPGANESIFLTYCDSDDSNCEDGLHWLDKFYAKFYDAKQEQIMISDLNGENLTDEEKALVRRHRVGVAGMVGMFTIAMFIIDNSAQ
tara:strand:+ start:429 stop:1154 length:726 start_codon:yes stop_codon:yes gene_type:complete